MARKKLLVMPATARTLPKGPVFLYRPEYNEHKFLEWYPRSSPFDGALIAARHLARWPDDHEKAERASGRELAEALILSGSPFLVDPDTPILTVVGGSVVAPSVRIVTMAHAQVLRLPLSTMSFGIESDRVDFADAAVAAQRGAAGIVAPYFEVETVGDGWHGVNLELVDDVRRRADGRTLVACVQVPLRSLSRGELEHLAPTYRGLGIQRVLLRVSGFDPAIADAADIAAYRRGLDAFGSEGIEPIADCTGRFGLVAVGAGAGGFSSGARHYQSIPESLIYEPGPDSGSDPLMYEVPRRWYAMLQDEARVKAEQGVIPECPLQDCRALATGAKRAALREHLVHYFTQRTRDLAAGGSAVARRSLTRHPSTNTASWLSAL